MPHRRVPFASRTREHAVAFASRLPHWEAALTGIAEAAPAASSRGDVPDE